jgi:hypothetical protein
MMNHHTLFAALPLMLALVHGHCTTLHAQSTAAAAAAPTVTGSWKVSLYGQHVIPVGMELKQDGRKVTGTLMMWNGDVPLEGEIVDGKLKVSGRHEPTDGTAAGDRTVTATILANGSLEGTFGGYHGEIKLTAERFTDRAARRGAATAAPAAPASSADASPFAGKWRLNIGEGTQARTMQIEIAVNGGAITGTLTSDHSGPLQIRNARIANGALVFGVPMGEVAVVEFTASLEGHDALSGSLAGPMGPATFTGERVR